MKLEKPVDSKDDPSSHAPKTKAEEYCELGKAKRAIEDIRIIVEELSKAAGFEKHPFSSGATIGLVSKN